MSASSLDAAAEHSVRSPELTRTRTLSWQDPVPTAAAGAEMAGIDYMRAIGSGELPPPPIAVVMRMRPVEVDSGSAVFEGEPGEEHYNPIGVVHGGYAATLLDSALGCAVHTTLAPGEGYTSLGLEVKFLRAITRDVPLVRCRGEVIHRGRRQATAEARITDPEGERIYATATSTCMIFS